MTMRATQTSLNPQRKNLCRRLLHAARHRLQTQIRYTPITQAQPHTIPFSSFQLFHFAFSYTLTIPFLSYGKVEHARSTDIAISDRSLLEQRVTRQLVLVAHRLRWMPTTNELCNLVEFLLSHHILYTLSTSRSDISHSQQTILYFFFNFFFSFISFIRNFNASKCAFNSSKFVLFRVK